MIIADTDVLIDYLAGAEPIASEIVARLQRNALSTTVVSRFELLAGARSARQKAATHDLLSMLPALPLEASSADRAAEVRRKLERAGATIGMADSLIAGIVLEAGGLLMTRNRKHFERVEGLKLA